MRENKISETKIRQKRKNKDVENWQEKKKESKRNANVTDWQEKRRVPGSLNALLLLKPVNYEGVSMAGL